jgi:pimeloyl-ACP methyl ester carboxylesterase
MKIRALRLGLAVLLFFVPSAQSDDAAKKTVVKAADGLPLVYDTKGAGDTALVFLHGWCGSRTWWKSQMDAFSGDYRCIAYDQAGHGDSGKDRKEWTGAALAADVEAVVKGLGLKRVILVGHSMGGPIALGAAKRLPGTVIAVVGVDTLQNAENEPSEEQTKAYLSALESDFKGAVQMGLRGMLPEKTEPKVFDSIAAVAEKQNKTMAMSLMKSFSTVDLKTLLREAKVPVRCINSAGGFMFFTPTDATINKKYADYGAILIENVGHFPMLEKPAEFNERLRGVLKELAAKR